MSNRNRTIQVVFQKLDVSIITNNAGIFIGTNKAHSWSSHYKNNSGFGTGGGDIRNCTNVLYDNDYIDSPVDDRDNVIIHENGGESDNQSIGIQSINVESIEANSTISVGANAQQGWSSHSKANNGQGIAGSNRSQKTLNYISDDDAIDTPIRNIGVSSSSPVKK